MTPYLLLERTLSKDGHYAGVGEEQDSTLQSELCRHPLTIRNKSGVPRGHRALWEAGVGGGVRGKLSSFTKRVYYLLVPKQVSAELVFSTTPNGLHLTQCIKNQNAFTSLDFQDIIVSS